MSGRPKRVVPGRVYRRGTVGLLCLITAFQRHENTCTHAKSQWQANTDKDTLTGTHTHTLTVEVVMRWTRPVRG